MQTRVPGDGESLSVAAVLAILRRHRRLLAVLVVAGALLGGVLALAAPRTYQSHSQVLLQNLQDPNEVDTQAQVAMSLAVLDRAAPLLSWKATADDLRGSVTAAAGDGSVIDIRAEWSDAGRARELAKTVSEQFIAYSTDLLTRSADATKQVLQRQQQQTQQRIADLNAQIAQLEQSFQLLDPRVPEGAGTRAQLDQARAERGDSITALAALDQQISDADLAASVAEQNMRIIDPAAEPSSSEPPTPLQLIVGAGLLAGLAGAFALVGARLRDRRLGRRADITAAVGAPLLATVRTGPPAGPDDEPVTGRARWWARLRQLVRPDPAAAPGPEGERLERLQYERLLARLAGHGPEPVRVLAVVLDKDPEAAGAATRLAEAAGPAQPVTVRTEVLTTARPVLLSVDRPARAVVVVSPGVATAWELFGAAEACHQAGVPVVGVLLVGDVHEEDVQLQAEDRPGSPADGGPAVQAPPAELSAAGVPGRAQDSADV